MNIFDNRTEREAMFSVFRRRAASANRSDPPVKEGPLTETNGRKANAENNACLTPTISTNGHGLKHRTLSGVSLSSSSSFSTSPMLNITRQQEKQELQTLNDRLAVIIDTVRRLEQDNEKLRAMVKTNAESYETETCKVKTLYENELDDAKKLIEELAHEKSRLEIELERTRCENVDSQNRSTRFDRDLRNYETRLRQYETEIAELKVRCETINAEFLRKNEEVQSFHQVQQDLEKQISSLKRQLESETLLRIDLENKNKTLREQLEFNEQVHLTQIEQIKEQQRYELTHTEGLRQQYDDKLLQELQQLRAQNDQEMILLREEIAVQYEKKIDDLQHTNRRFADQINNYRADLVSYRERIEEVTKSRDAANEKMIQLEQRCRELEDRAYRAQQQQHDTLVEREQDIQALKDTIDQMQIDYQNLLDTKIGLDREISTYRKLLDSEEERLNIGTRYASNSIIVDDVVATPPVAPVSQRQRNKRARREIDNDETEMVNGH